MPQSATFTPDDPCVTLHILAKKTCGKIGEVLMHSFFPWDSSKQPVIFYQKVLTFRDSLASRRSKGTQKRKKLKPYLKLMVSVLGGPLLVMSLMSLMSLRPLVKE